MGIHFAHAENAARDKLTRIIYDIFTEVDFRFVDGNEGFLVQRRGGARGGLVIWFFRRMQA